MDLIRLLNSKNKFLNAVIILSAIVVSYNIYMNQDKSTSLLKEKRDLEQKKNEILNNIIESEKRIDLYKSFVNKKDISSIINSLSGIANECSVNIASVKPLEKKDFPVFVLYPFQLSIKTKNYNDIGKFISKLENSPDVYVIETANFRSGAAGISDKREDNTENINIVLELTLHTVIFK